jgi:uncharacterized protein YraI
MAMPTPYLLGVAASVAVVVQGCVVSAGGLHVKWGNGSGTHSSSWWHACASAGA